MMNCVPRGGSSVGPSSLRLDKAMEHALQARAAKLLPQLSNLLPPKDPRPNYRRFADPSRHTGETVPRSRWVDHAGGHAAG